MTPAMHHEHRDTAASPQCSGENTNGERTGVLHPQTKILESKAGFLHLSTTDVWGGIMPCHGGGAGGAGTLPDGQQHPDLSPVTTKHVSTHCQMSPRR